METSLFCCPLCGGALTRRERSLFCPKGHCFDLSKEGYANLLPVGQKHAKFPGDDPGMVAARSQFLAAGYYLPLPPGARGSGSTLLPGTGTAGSGGLRLRGRVLHRRAVPSPGAGRAFPQSGRV